mgnify:CR=1 FL=1
MPFERRPREMHDAKCGDCGKDCQVPFEPRQDKPVYCDECFQNHKPARSSGGFGGRDRGSRYGGRNDRGSSYGGRSDRGSSYERRPREMHKATCADCGNECEIPFKPKDARPVYCNECFQKHKQD